LVGGNILTCEDLVGGNILACEDLGGGNVLACEDLGGGNVLACEDVGGGNMRRTHARAQACLGARRLRLQHTLIKAVLGSALQIRCLFLVHFFVTSAFPFTLSGQKTSHLSLTLIVD